MSLPIQDFQTHFLLPFRFDRRSKADFIANLLAMKWNKGAQSLWTQVDSDEVARQFLDNILPSLKLADTFELFVLTEEATAALQFCGMPFPRENFPLAKFGNRRALVCLNRYGGGIFLINVTAEISDGMTTDDVMAFNHYHHRGRPIEYPLGGDPNAPRSYFHEESRPLVAYVDSGGNKISAPLIELVKSLLPASSFENKLQRGLSVHTAVRLKDPLDFGSRQTRRQCASALGKLQRIMLPSFSALSESSLADNTLLLNNCHWMCLGHLGAAHLLTDQPQMANWLPDENRRIAEYNESKRLHNAMGKVFVPYLYALMQRLSLQCLNGEAIDLIHRSEDPDDAYSMIEDLRNGLMDFMVRSQPDLLSNEDNGSLVYRHSQRVLEVNEAQQRLHRVLADIDAKRISKHEIEMQHNLHWLELLIFTVYAVELAIHFSAAFGVDPHRPSIVTGWGLVVLTIIALCFAAQRLGLSFLRKPNESRAEKPVSNDVLNRFLDLPGIRRVDRRWMMIFGIGLAVGVYIVVGRFFQSAAPTQDGHVENVHSPQESPKQPSISIQINEPLEIKVGAPQQGNTPPGLAVGPGPVEKDLVPDKVNNAPEAKN